MAELDEDDNSGGDESVCICDGGKVSEDPALNQGIPSVNGTDAEGICGVLYGRGSRGAF